MGLSSAMQWWEEWQLRILILASCFIQYVLFFSLWMRRAPSMRRFRVLLWIAYIGGDAVAIYALATLFNRRKGTSDGDSSGLEVLWAPILLIHLGGQVTISAYSLEDNELWKRHTITLASQVTVALYVFCKWWSGEKMLLSAAILLFLIGILKFAQKPWALRTSSFNSLEASSIVFLLQEAQTEECIHSLAEYVPEAKHCVLETKVDTLQEDVTDSDYMFVNLSAPYSFRIAQLRSFLKLEDVRAYHALQGCLGDTFDSMFTKIGSINIMTSVGAIGLVFLLPFLTLASMVIFTTSHKDGQNEKDITVTYILFGCTTMLEFLLPFMMISLVFPCFESFLDKYTSGWHDMVSQYNLISFCIRKKKPTFMMKLATFNFLREFIHKYWYIQHVPVAFEITGVVRQHVKHGWKTYICDTASYRRFNELRGQWALRRHHQLGWSLKKPFDESVLIWHIATDLCFYHPNTSPQCRQREGTQRSREISNYMVYLLLIRPEMLMPGTRSDLFTLVSNKILGSSKGPFDTEELIAQEILDMPILPTPTDLVSNASKLAKAQMELSDEKERWNVIEGVWVEMLCYSASRCRGYLHAKSLGEGGECLTTICILLSLMGMETFADRHQRSEPPEEEEGEGEEQGEEEEEPCTSRAQGRASQSADNYSPV
ncbi:hypothetical protein QYE76_007018 [Lolium multiflorum]|uniref:DUF4220 domain-containing protein n=1 Tax=Lolium multiflorum TaxID=4521 RepID=A0AAD8W4N8_LOLMU|nr:hypothetical protein QYE76_007018 [Lolium multiflorum]